METPEKRAGVTRLLLRWPHRRAELLRAAKRPAFASLCESYALAWEAALHWAKIPGNRAAEIAEEYRLLLGELEQDIALLCSTTQRTVK